MTILQKFTEADAVLLATPVYYYDVSAWMKIFIDRTYFLYTHDISCRAKAAGLIVVAGAAGNQDAVRTLEKLLDISMVNGSRGKRFVVSGYASAPGDVRKNLKLVTQAQELGRKLVESCRES
jgi:multimeric flavodoxin WrbA